ncbi:MAG: preprotein translocase subunit SecE [Acidimicrobiales bacterium]
MAMNRETKRRLQRQGHIGADGAPTRPKQPPRQPPRPSAERTGPRQYVQEVRAELRKVAWPHREEVVRYSVIVLFALVVLTSYIFGLDLLFAKGVFLLFES